MWVPVLIIAAGIVTHSICLIGPVGSCFRGDNGFNCAGDGSSLDPALIDYNSWSSPSHHGIGSLSPSNSATNNHLQPTINNNDPFMRHLNEENPFTNAWSNSNSNKDGSTPGCISNQQSNQWGGNSMPLWRSTSIQGEITSTSSAINNGTRLVGAMGLTSNPSDSSSKSASSHLFLLKA